MRTAVLTIVWNEKDFFPHWYKYYSGLFSADDIYVIDNGSTDGSTDLANNVYKVQSPFKYDNDFLRNTVFRYSKLLLDKYDVIVYAEADEFLVCDDWAGCIGRAFRCGFVRATGYEVIQLKDEPPIDFSQPLMQQRSKMYLLKNFYKPCVFSEPQIQCRDFFETDLLQRNLLLFHTHRVDYGRSKNRLLLDRTQQWSEKDLSCTSGWQHRIEDSAFDNWFYGRYQAQDKDTDIPEGVKNAF